MCTQCPDGDRKLFLKMLRENIDVMMASCGGGRYELLWECEHKQGSLNPFGASVRVSGAMGGVNMRQTSMIE